MIEFPETASTEWDRVSKAAQASVELKKRIERGVAVEHALEKLRVQHEAKLLFQAELDSASTPTLNMTSLADYQTTVATTAMPDLIDGVLKAEGMCTVLGPSGSGKSTMALQMVHSLATGDAWLGQNATALTGAFGILSYDMPQHLLMDWMSGFPNLDPNKVSVVDAYKQGNPLGVTSMRAQIAAHWQSLGVEVVVLDSFSASFMGHDQNDAGLVQAHYRDLKLFALTEVGAKVLIVIVHSTEDRPDRARGSTVHKDASDTMVSVVADKNTTARTVRMEKYRAARGQAEMSPVVVTAPDSVTHLVGLDLNNMMLAGYDIPATAGAALFEDEPELNEAPDVTQEEGDDDL